MLFDAIFQKVLHLPPEQIFRGMMFVAFLIGLIASFAPSVVFHLMELTPKAKALNRRELNADLQRKYEGVCAELAETKADRAFVVKENIRLTGLLREEHSHNKDWDIRARRELDARKERGA